MEFLNSLVGNNAMIFSAVILILAYIFIATEKIPKVTIALIGAALTMFLGLVSVNKNLSDGSLDPHYFVNFIDFNVIFLLVAMMIIVNISTATGMFNWYRCGYSCFGCCYNVFILQKKFKNNS